jgi:HAD superfamily hydrolase (TIGR01484 family)
MTSSKFKDKDLIVFDLDGTLTESKMNLRPDMSRALAALLQKKKIAIIGGAKYAQFERQFVGHLKCPRPLLANLFLFPTNATAFHRFSGGKWKRVYYKALSLREKLRIKKAFRATFRKAHYVHPEKIWGKVIEDRGTEVTFSALGQKAPLAAKECWNRTSDVRPKLMRILRRLLPELEVREGGETSIDVTWKGIDKAYGVREIEKYLHIPIRGMVFIGDALFRGGNDAAAKKTGVECVAVHGPKDTKKIIKKILKEN